MNIGEVLRDWREAPVEMRPLAALTTREGLQPRVLDAVHIDLHPGLERQSAEWVRNMTRTLEGNRTSDLEPLLVASIGGELVVVDGHHRLLAYAEADRIEVPCRVKPLLLLEAYTLSRIVNTDSRALPLQKDQNIEAAWQYILQTWNPETEKFPRGQGMAKIATQFGISSGTVQNMVDAARSGRADLTEWDPNACCPVSGRVRWKYLKSNRWFHQANEVSPRERREAEIQVIISGLARLKERSPSAAMFNEALTEFIITTKADGPLEALHAPSVYSPSDDDIY